ncbi:FtsX-like permease family protein [Ruania albidiflava]|uniref:FtsX-like permease family protein n=1 Tax=Ruania albidiflava TaxID=366586 RepID=UPI0023F42CE4|nr:FtsX-like permease family protein [Ruania albidiflava]
MSARTPAPQHRPPAPRRGSSRMRWHLLLRQARSGLGATIALLVIVAVTAGVFTAWPRLERETFADEVGYQISTTPPTLRALTASTEGYPVDSGEGWQTWTEAIDELIIDAGPELTAGTGTPRTSVTTEALSMHIEHGKPDTFYQVAARLRADPDIEDYITLLEGAAPGPSPWPSTRDGFMAQAADQSLEPADVMLSQDTAQALELEVGDRFDLPVFFGRLPLQVSGVFAANDPAADQWQFQLNTLSPRIDNDPNQGLAATAMAYIGPDDLTWLQAASELQPETELWVPVQPSATDAEVLITQLRTLTATTFHVDTPGGTGTLSLDFSAGLVDVLGGAVDRWRGTAAVLAMVAAGPIGVALAILALATRVMVARREVTLALAHARGASSLQLRSLLGLEGVVLGLPVAALGAAVATVALPGAFQIGDYWLALGAGLAPGVFLAATRLPNLRARRGDLALRSASRWRWVAEVALVALTAAAVYLVVTRGVSASGAGTDPVAAAVPLLLALTVCVLAVRLLPLPLGALHAAARRGRGLSAFLGSARTIREGGLALVPMFALVVGTAIAVFATTMITTLEHGTDAGARAEVGADVRLTGERFSAEDVEAISEVNGVRATTTVSTAPSIPLYQGDDYERVTVYAVESSTQGEVQTDVPGAVVLPGDFGELDQGALPVIVSSTPVVDAEKDPFLLFDDHVPITVLEQVEAAPGLLVQSTDWVLADLTQMRELTGLALLPRTVLVDIADDADAHQVLGELDSLLGDRATMESPAQSAADFSASPAATSMQAGFLVALVLCVLLAVAAIVMTLVLAAPARRRLLAVLRTLGVPPRTSGRLVAWETVPVVVAAMVSGTLVGLTLPHLVSAGIDLRPFTGAQTQPPVVYDPLLLVGVLVALAVVLALCVWLATVVARRLSLSVLRIGEAS